MDKILSIFSLFSIIWSNFLLVAIIDDNEYFSGLPGSIEDYRMLAAIFLIYLIVFFYNIFTIRFCSKVQKEKQTSKIPTVISLLGTILFLDAAIIILLSASIVIFTGGV